MRVMAASTHSTGSWVLREDQATPAVPTTAICCLTVLLAVCEEQVEIKWEL